MAANNNAPAAFVLDDRPIEKKLDVFRAYSQLLPFDPRNMEGPSWAQALLGYKAGMQKDAPDFSPDDWSNLRDHLARLYNQPEQADGNLPPEHAFLLTLSGLLETPQALLNQLPARHKTLYYQQMLALKPQEARADQLTVHFTLADGVREQVLAAGLEFEAGQDSAGTPLRYALTQPLSVNAARVTDLRWLVRDPCVPGGYRARIILDESAGVAWPAGGVRMFSPSPAQPGQPPRVDADRAVYRGRIIESSLLAIAGGVRYWTVTFAGPLKGKVQAAVSVGDVWVALNAELKSNNTVVTLMLAVDGGTPTAVTALDGLTSDAPLLRLTSDGVAALPEITRLEVTVTGATNVLCADDEGNTLTGGGLPFGQNPAVGSGVNLMSAAWWQLGNRLKSVTVTPVWSGLPAKSFPDWYGPDPTQDKDNWLYLDQDLNVTRDTIAGMPVNQVNTFPQGRASRVTNAADFAPGKMPVRADPGYPDPPKSNADFTVLAEIMGPDGTGKALASPLPLFTGDKAPVGLALSIPLNGLPPAPVGVAVPDSDDPVKWPWYLRLVLDTDFLQQAYAAHQAAPARVVTFITKDVMSQQVPVMVPAKNMQDETVMIQDAEGKDTSTPALTTRMIEIKGPDGKALLVPAMETKSVDVLTSLPVQVPGAQWNAPYLPQWSGIRVDYTAQEDTPHQRVITPFGYALQDDPLTHPPAAAEIYLGIDGIEEGQLLTLYWQLRSPEPLVFDWQYLMPGERWVRLPVENETADAFSNSGRGSVIWPGDATRTATSMPAGRMWIRGRALTLPGRDALRVALPVTPWVSRLVTNAATATLLNARDIQADHFITGLPAESVTQALNAPETLQSVEQIWPSFGGQPAENRDAFEARVARRLRHRERALNDLDIKTLLHEQHAGLRELKILPPRPDADGSLIKTVVVMPDTTQSDSSDARRPALSSMHLNTMAEGIKAIASPWLKLGCISPVYVPISVGWAVTYTPGLSRTTVEARAHRAMERAFMPWYAAAGDDAGTPVIGHRITHSAVRDVLRNVPGVKSIEKVFLNGSEDTEPDIAPDQVAVVTCIPEEYVGLTLAWYQGRRPGALWGELTLMNDSTFPAIVHITWPKTVTGLGAAPIVTADAEVHLVDLDSGQWLNDTTSPLKAKTAPDDKADAPEKDYADFRGSEQANLSLNTRALAVSHSVTCGVFHLGVALVLRVNGQPDVTLSPDVVGQRITLNIAAAGE